MLNWAKISGFASCRARWLAALGFILSISRFVRQTVQVYLQPIDTETAQPINRGRRSESAKRAKFRRRLGSCIMDAQTEKAPESHLVEWFTRRHAARLLENTVGRRQLGGVRSPQCLRAVAAAHPRLGHLSASREHPGMSRG
jgi:hypothetical protein